MAKKLNALAQRLHAVRLAQLGEHRYAEREVAGSDPGWTNTQDLKKKTGEIMRLCWLCSVEMIASLGGDVKPLALSPSSFFYQSKLKVT